MTDALDTGGLRSVATNTEEILLGLRWAEKTKTIALTLQHVGTP